jgi:hypothetical protein
MTANTIGNGLMRSRVPLEAARRRNPRPSLKLLSGSCLCENVTEISPSRLEVARRMRPTSDAVTLAMARFPELATTLVSVHRSASELRLVYRRGAEQ